MQAAEILFVNVPYGRCRIVGCVCSDNNCKLCSIPIVMKAEAREIIRKGMYY